MVRWVESKRFCFQRANTYSKVLVYNSPRENTAPLPAGLRFVNKNLKIFIQIGNIRTSPAILKYVVISGL